MIKNAKRIVIKIGSSLVIKENNQAKKSWLASLTEDIVALKKQKKEIVIVTSGAVALGRKFMGYDSRPLVLEEKQAAAACGQIKLFSLWEKTLHDSGLYPAQILLTADDSIHRRRYLNARNTLETLLENRNILPIINENDSLATAELRFGDNDRLAARVAQMVGADLLVILSDVDGLYDQNPREHPNALFQEKITEITEEIEAMAGGAGSLVGTGGMTTKIAAAKIATSAGCHTIIARGTEKHPIKSLVEGGKSTLFLAKENPLSARKHWIAGSLHPAGTITVDKGAEQALKNEKSLLPVGVSDISGEFDRGDAVLICNSKGKLLGRGLIAYNSHDTKRIIGKKSREIEKVLGFKRRDVLIHRDDMVLE